IKSGCRQHNTTSKTFDGKVVALFEIPCINTSIEDEENDWGFDEPMIEEGLEAIKSGCRQHNTTSKTFDGKVVALFEIPCINTSIEDEENDWGFYEPMIEEGLVMEGHVQKAQERLKMLKF
ncbi:hypothetical protein GOP47_0024146, partial [Adiantum capillus-veneris]